WLGSRLFYEARAASTRGLALDPGRGGRWGAEATSWGVPPSGGRPIGFARMKSFPSGARSQSSRRPTVFAKPASLSSRAALPRTPRRLILLSAHPRSRSHAARGRSRRGRPKTPPRFSRQLEVRVPKARSTAARTDRAAPPLVRSKLSQPNPAGPVLDRPRLLAALAEHAARSLTLVTAEAGYGKTTLLGAFAQRTRRPVVWYSLMPSDADPVVFGRYLLEGFRRDTPRFGRDFERALDEARPGARSIEMLGGTLANELATLRGPATLLVLDDFQEVTGNSQVVALTDTILRFLPASVRVVIASRATPPLALERLRAKGELFELTSSHLRLTREELAKLFAEVYRRPLVEAELAALEDTTLGWPTAVHLIHESL